MDIVAICHAAEVKQDPADHTKPSWPGTSRTRCPACSESPLHLKAEVERELLSRLPFDA